MPSIVLNDLRMKRSRQDILLLQRNRDTIVVLALQAHLAERVVIQPRMDGDAVSYLHHPSEALVANDEEIIAGRSAAILGRVDFLIGTVDSNLENLDQNSTPVGYCIYRWFFKFRQVNTIRLARDYGDRLQFESSFKDC